MIVQVQKSDIMRHEVRFQLTIAQALPEVEVAVKDSACALEDRS